jgi:3-oxoacyl-[acyl-carrier protein] reductase
MDLGLGGATAVVQGGTQGMGRAAAESLAREGARVAVLARTVTALDETSEVLGFLGSPDSVGIPTDLTSRLDVDRAFRSVAERWGSLNVLVNAAGPRYVGLFEDTDDDEWRATLDIGILSAVRCTRAALPLLRSAPWARIVNVSAHSTKRQSAPLAAYTASKAALTSLSKNLSVSLAPEGYW